jgi:DNA-binding MarR family transcriptional regulator
MVQNLGGRATWVVSRANARGHALLQEAFAAAGSRPYYYRILAALSEHGPASQADIGRSTGIDRSDVTTSLDALCEAGFAARDPDPADRRRNLVSLTGPGRAELQRLDAVLDAVQAQFLARLTVSEQEVVLGLMTRLAGDDATSSVDQFAKIRTPNTQVVR